MRRRLADTSSTLSARLDATAKHLLLLTILIYALGTLIDGIHLCTLGISDYSALKPRAILVGVTFVLYLLVLCATVAVPLFAAIWVIRARRRASSQQLTAFLSISTWIVTTFAFFWVVPYPFNYFTNTGLEVGAVLSVQREFWRILLHPWWWVQLPLLIVAFAATWLLYGDSTAGRISGQFSNRILLRRILLAGAVVGIVSCVMPYVVYVMPNIDFPVGGARPRLIRLEIGKSNEDASGSSETKWLGHPDTHLLLWYETSDKVYLSRQPRDKEGYSSGGLAIIELPRTRVLATRYLPGKIAIVDSKFLIPKTFDFTDVVVQIDQLGVELKRKQVALLLESLLDPGNKESGLPSGERIAGYIKAHPEAMPLLEDRKLRIDFALKTLLKVLRSLNEESPSTTGKSRAKNASSQPSSTPVPPVAEKARLAVPARLPSTQPAARAK